MDNISTLELIYRAAAFLFALLFGYNCRNSELSFLFCSVNSLKKSQRGFFYARAGVKSIQTLHLYQLS